MNDNNTTIIDVEWLDISGTTPMTMMRNIGFVLVFNEHAGFKVYAGNATGVDESYDREHIYRHGTKIPFDWAWGIWGKRMKTEWMHRHLADYDDVKNIIRYDGVNHEIRK